MIEYPHVCYETKRIQLVAKTAENIKIVLSTQHLASYIFFPVKYYPRSSKTS